jgi:REP element-mobilizing transposase RayT
MNLRPHQKDLRKGRYEEKGFYYFITTITKEREKLFLHPGTATIVMDALKWLDENNRIELIAALVMPDHLHFVSELKEGPLSKVMHSLKSFTANEINKFLDHKGQVWEKQYYEQGIRDEKMLMEKVKYCIMNPVRKGLVDDFRKYEYWYCKYEL